MALWPQIDTTATATAAIMASTSEARMQAIKERNQLTKQNVKKGKKR